ncbi:Ribonuclease 3 like protein [Verticillium longisporum]|nr:Ribonuclease 3 like protein [Verticillium longisporum]
MSKRTREEGPTHELQGRPGSSKRPHIDGPPGNDIEPLDVMLAHANKLVKRIEDLRNALQAGDLSSDIRRREKLTTKLRGTCQDILPSITAFTGEKVASPDAASGASKEHQSSNTHADEGTIHPPKPSTSAPACSPIPSPLILSAFTTNEIASSLPPLPPIRDPKLETAVFTHYTVGPGLNYERLEWLGDAYTEIISTSLLFRTFGGFSSGKLSQLRELLICNANLGQYSAQYGLVERVRAPEEVKASKEKWKKVPGDVFESYVAAVILSDPEHGLERAGEWLKALFSMTIKHQISTISTKPEHKAVLEMGDLSLLPDKVLNAKVRLGQLIGAKGINLRYEDDTSGPKFDKFHKRLAVHSVNLYLDGWGEKNKWLGKGTDINKKEAGQKAAQMALDNKAMIKKYSEKKQVLQAAKAAAGEDDDDQEP